MLVCEICKTAECGYQKKSIFTIFLNPRFKDLNTLCICDNCWIEMYKKMVNRKLI